MSAAAAAVDAVAAAVEAVPVVVAAAAAAVEAGSTATTKARAVTPNDAAERACAKAGLPSAFDQSQPFR